MEIAIAILSIAVIYLTIKQKRNAMNMQELNAKAEALQASVDELEIRVENMGSENGTEAERQALGDKIDSVKAAIDAIAAPAEEGGE